MEQFQKQGNEIDQDRKLTDCFLFDRTSNVQTTGAILCATYPQTICFVDKSVLVFQSPLQTQTHTGL